MFTRTIDTSGCKELTGFSIRWTELFHWLTELIRKRAKIP